ncbi:MAG: 23S rRNA (guanosine(2251)-2'-O)-methyltransferase RlmB [Terriglobales bacterium]
MDVIYGLHPVEEAVRSRPRALDYVAVSRERHDARLQRVIDQCRAAGVSLRFAPREELTRLARTASHQGVVAIAAARQYADLEDLLHARRGRHAFIVVLDGVEDPHNLGAIIRTANAAGADGIVVPERRAVGITATVSKAAAGAAEHLPIARVTNINRVLEELKTHNVWTVGLDERGTQTYDALDYNMDCALVLGAEGAGLHELVRKRCDFLVSIPVMGKVPSLNVSVAAAVVLYEAARQRRAAQK